MVDWQSVCAVTDVALIPCRDWPGECSESWVDDPHTGQQGRSGATNQVPAGGRVPSQNRGRATQHCAIPTVPAGKGLGVLRHSSEKTSLPFKTHMLTYLYIPADVKIKI